MKANQRLLQSSSDAADSDRAPRGGREDEPHEDKSTIAAELADAAD